MKKAKLRRFAEWLREQPNTTLEGEPAFNWFSAPKCVAAYAQAWAYGSSFSFGRSEDFEQVFNMPHITANDLYVAGARQLTAKGFDKITYAKLSKVADVIDLLAEGWGVEAAMEAVFGKRVFVKRGMAQWA